MVIPCRIYHFKRAVVISVRKGNQGNAAQIFGIFIIRKSIDCLIGGIIKVCGIVFALTVYKLFETCLIFQRYKFDRPNLWLVIKCSYTKEYSCHRRRISITIRKNYHKVTNSLWLILRFDFQSLTGNDDFPIFKFSIHTSFHLLANEPVFIQLKWLEIHFARVFCVQNYCDRITPPIKFNSILTLIRPNTVISGTLNAFLKLHLPRLRYLSAFLKKRICPSSLSYRHKYFGQ